MHVPFGNLFSLLRGISYDTLDCILPLDERQVIKMVLFFVLGRRMQKLRQEEAQAVEHMQYNHD